MNNGRARVHRWNRFLRSWFSILRPPLPKQSAAIWLVVVGGAVALVGASCSVETRYRVLTFFFEGVPPPGSKPKAAAAAPTAQAHLANPVSFHRTYRDDRCSECHEDKKAPLKQPVPDLCWKCHSRPPAAPPWNHAPERVGECMACHVAHETMMPHLLVQAGKELCYQCHRDNYMQALPAHKGADPDQCLNCHPYHVGGTRLPAQAGQKSQ